MSLITVASTALPGLKTYKVMTVDIDGEGSTRSETGVKHRERVRAGVYEITCSFIVTKTQLKIITDAIAPASFSVTFFDPTASSNPIITMEASDITADLILNDATEANTMWQISFTLTEY